MYRSIGHYLIRQFKELKHTGVLYDECLTRRPHIAHIKLEARELSVVFMVA